MLLVVASQKHVADPSSMATGFHALEAQDFRIPAALAQKRIKSFCVAQPMQKLGWTERGWGRAFAGVSYGIFSWRLERAGSDRWREREPVVVGRDPWQCLAGYWGWLTPALEGMSR